MSENFKIKSKKRINKLQIIFINIFLLKLKLIHILMTEVSNTVSAISEDLD